MSEHEMRQVLTRLELCSMTRAAGLAPTGTGQKPGSVIPSLGEMPPADHWRKQYNRALTDQERADCLTGASGELRSITHGPGLILIHAETKDERAARILNRKNTGWPAQDVALSERVPLREVLNARTDADLDPASGKPWPRDEDRDAKIRRLKADGMPYRTIADLCQVSIGTVHNVLNRAV